MSAPAPGRAPLVEVVFEVPATADTKPWRTIIGRVVRVDGGLVVIERNVPTPKGTRISEIPSGRVITIDHLPDQPPAAAPPGEGGR